MLALDERDDLAFPALTTGLTATIGLAQALGDAGVGAPLWLVTRHAVTTGPGDAPVRPRQAQLRGLACVLGLEHPDRWGGLLDVPATVDEPMAVRALRALSGDEDQLAVRATGAHGRRLDRTTGGARTARPIDWSGGTVLISGGTGALGAAVARWLAGQGAGQVLLAGRSGPDAPGAAELAAELGPRARLVACDVADRDQVARLLAGIPPELPLRAVFHAAGVLDDGVFDALGPERFDRVSRAKVLGARHLDELTEGLDLAAFVLFSSVTATLGSAGQANYAVANAYLDGLAEQRAARGLAATSIAWGPWAGGGMATSSEAAGRHWGRNGMSAMAPDSAILALGHALDRGDTCVTIADIDWERLHAAHPATRPGALFERLPGFRRTVRPAGEPAGKLRDRLRGLSAEDGDRAVLDLVRGQAAVALGHDSAVAVEPGRAFRDLGFDSLTVVELRNLLGAATGLRLPATVIFDHPTPAVLAAHLRAELTPGEDPQETTILADLDELEVRLATVDGGQGAIAQRLLLMAQRLAPPDLPTQTDDLDAATLEDMLGIVEDELGARERRRSGPGVLQGTDQGAPPGPAAAAGGRGRQA